LEEALLGGEGADDADDRLPPLGGAAVGERSLAVELPGGTLRFFYGDGRFEATCYNDAHRTVDGTRCRLTRTAVGAEEPIPPGSEANGRPAGLMGAWLAYHILPSREDHRAVFFVATIPRDERISARDQIRDAPRGALLLSCERHRRLGEPEEPLDCPMGW
jgi:hypothetical protein